MTTWATMQTMEEVAQVIKMLQQQVAELQTEVLKLQAEKQTWQNTKTNLSKKAGKVVDFDGRQESRQEWVFKFKRHVDGLHAGAEEFMEWAATQQEEIEMSDLKNHRNPEAQEISGVIYYLITRHTSGEALEVAKMSPRKNGAELWRKICKRYDPRTSIKRAALLNDIIQQKAVQIEELGHELDKWCAKVKLYESRTNGQLQDDLKMTIIQNMCPQSLRLHLELNSARIKTSEQMRNEIRAHLEARQPQPMQLDSHEYSEDHCVDSFGQKGKGKGKGCFNCGGPHLARECVSKGKGKSKTVECYTCGGNHMARNCDAGWQHNGKGKGPQQFDGYCYKCGRHGHDGANCWTSKGKDKGKGKGKTKGKPMWSFEQADNEAEWQEQEGEDWQGESDEISGTLEDVCEVRADEDHFGKITIDSGAAVCVAPPSWCPQYKTQQSAGSRMGVQYVTASGNKIKNEGEKRIKIQTKAGDVRQMTFQIAKVTKPLCSVSKICEKGHAVVFDESGSYIKHKRTGKIIPPKKERGVYVMDAAIMRQASWMNDDGQQLASAEHQDEQGRGF